MANNIFFSEEQIDFLTEMINIGGDNASVMFSQFFGTNVNVAIPEVHAVASQEIPSLPFYTSVPVTLAQMSLLGDIKGSLFFIIKDSQRAFLTRLAEKVFRGKHVTRGEKIDDPYEWFASILKEVANIFAGIFFSAINTFCGLKVNNTPPNVKSGTMKSVLDEISEDNYVVIIKNVFTVYETPIEIIMSIVISIDFMQKFSETMRRLGRKEG